jgi:hypothetical protein
VRGDVGVKRHYEMPPTVTSAGNAHISNDAYDATALDEDPITMAPHPIEFVEERLIISYVTHLTRVIIVLLEGPVRGRGDDQMDGVIRDPTQLSCVPQMEYVTCCRNGVLPGRGSHGSARRSNCGIKMLHSRTDSTTTASPREYRTLFVRI